MSNYQIFSDSSCDTPDDILVSKKITRIPFYVSFDQKNYYKEIEQLSIEDFYIKLTSESIFPKTSLPSIEDYRHVFEKAINQGHDVLCICLTHNFSGSFQSAVTAKQILEEEYTDAKIHIVDSNLATSAQGLLVLQAAAMRDAGYSLEDNVKKLDELKFTSRIMFTVGTLEYLQKGGRIGKAAALAGSLLNLKPLIILKEGELLPYGKVRGRKKSYDKCMDMVKEYFNDMNASYKDFEFCITTGNNFHDAQKLKHHLEKIIGQTISLPIFTVGTTIGTNTGPDVIGICMIKRFDA